MVHNDGIIQLGIKLGGQLTLEGGTIRGSMKQTGLFLTTGDELFRHCVVFPKFEDTGLVVSAVGYRYGQRIRPTQSAVIHWTKPYPDEYCCRDLKLVKDLIHVKSNHKTMSDNPNLSKFTHNIDINVNFKT